MRNARPCQPLFADSRSELVYIKTAIGLCAVVAAKKAGLPCIWNMREEPSHVGGELRMPGLLRSLLPVFIRRHAQTRVFNNNAVLERMVYHPKNGKMIPIGVKDPIGDRKTTVAGSRRKLRLSIKDKINGVPGGLRPVKGHEWFIKSTTGLLTEREVLSVAVASDGDQELRGQLKALVEQLDLKDKVKFLGACKAMGCFHRACNLICIPSRSETFGRCAVEATACGTPVMAIRVGGLSTLAQDGEDGLSAPFGKESKLADAVRRLMDTREKVDRCVAAGRADCREHFSETVHQNKIYDLDEEVWGAAGRG
jgi:glycosyltransferase involved in cell wall biosynthesis